MDYKNLTLEELILLLEEVDDRLKENPLDSSANLRYNELLKLIEERNA